AGDDLGCGDGDARRVGAHDDLHVRVVRELLGDTDGVFGRRCVGDLQLDRPAVDASLFVDEVDGDVVAVEHLLAEAAEVAAQGQDDPDGDRIAGGVATGLRV